MCCSFVIYLFDFSLLVSVSGVSCARYLLFEYVLFHVLGFSFVFVLLPVPIEKSTRYSVYVFFFQLRARLSGILRIFLCFCVAFVSLQPPNTCSSGRGSPRRGDASGFERTSRQKDSVHTSPERRILRPPAGGAPP